MALVPFGNAFHAWFISTDMSLAGVAQHGVSLSDEWGTVVSGTVCV